MAPMRQLRNLLVNRSVGLPFFLLLCLLFFIQTTSTVVGRAYYHLVGLHADTLTNGTKSLLLVTLIVPFLILIATKPFRTRIPSSYFVIHVGLWLWFAGATISTLSHGRNPIVVLNYVAGVGSALAVFNAARRVPLTSVLHIEAVFAAVALGGLLPTLQSLVLYCQTWSLGRPSVAALYQARFEAYKWSVLGNRGNASVFFGLLASTCLAIVFLNVFSRTTRWLAAVVLVCSGALMVLCMSRTGIVVFALSGLTVIVFSRDAKAWCFSATLAILLILALPGTPVSTVPNYFLRALRYDIASDASAAARVESIREGWLRFVDHPFIGVGAGQSWTVVKEGAAHQLAISQATEHGMLGFLGVLVVTGACIVRLCRLLQAGAATSRQVCLEFVFLLGPAMYFVRGLFSETALNNTVVNSWICLAFAMLAVADTQAMKTGEH
jgi:O-antigen ligase